MTRMIRLSSLSRDVFTLHLTLVVALVAAAIANVTCMLAYFS